MLWTTNDGAEERRRRVTHRTPWKIAHVTATFPPYYGGTGNVCFHNARVLAARGHAVHVFTATWPGDADDPHGVHVHRFHPGVRIGNALLLPKLVTALRGFDVVHLHYPFIGGGDLAAALTGLRGMPLVVTYHNDLRAAGIRGRLFAFYERTASRALLNRTNRIAVVAAGYADASPTLRPLVQSCPGRVVEVPNGVDVSRFRPDLDGSAVRDRLGLPPDAFVVLFVGGLDTAHDFKRLDILLQAIHLATAPHIHGLVIGGGNLLPRYQCMATELGIGDRIHFVGPLPHADLPPYFAAGDVVVLPSDRTESFGLVLIEAMACARPVIATDLPGVRDVVSPGRDGLLVTPGDASALTHAICTFAGMPGATRRLFGEAGRTKAEERYDWERIGDRLERLYADVLGSKDVDRGC
jgi:glycosyltransferase involved in cell wall biosynthesis